MAGSPRNFDVEDFNKWKRRQGSSYKMPPRANFMAAANYIRNFFESKKLNWAVMMGLAMACLGSRREMLDIHIVYDDRDLNRIKMKLEADQRVRLQKGMNSLFPAKMLVATGPKFKDAGCTEDAEVEVDLVPPGAYGTPPNDVLKNSQVMLRLKHEGNPETFRGLNMLYLVKTTIAYCKSQDLAWDPKKDLLFLCQFYGREIELIRTQLNARQIQENFLGTPFVLRLSADEQRRCYHVLLGADKNPPPSMSLTPPPTIGHRLTASASDINSARPRITSHKSSPSLNTIQHSSKYLIPPLPGRPKKDKGLPQSAPPTAASVPIPQVPIVAPDQSSHRDSRSRYRHSSALHSPPDIRSPNHAANPQLTPRARSAERPTHPPEASVDQDKPISSHTHQQLPDPVKKSGHAATQVPLLPIGMRPQRSMPALVGRTVGPVPIFAHGVNTTASQIPKSSAPQTLPQTSSVSNFAFQAPQGHAKRYEGLQRQDYDVPKPPDARKRPPVEAQPHTPDISQFRLTADIGVTSSRNASDYQSGHTCTPVSDVRAERHVKPPASKSSQQSQSQSQSQPQRSTSQPLSQQRVTASGFVHELDASPQHHTRAPQSELPNEFIAELPADTESYHSEKEVILLPKISAVAESERTSMASPFAGDLNAIGGTIPHVRSKTMGQVFPSPPQSSEQARPLAFHTSPSVPGVLPSSLMIGHGRNVSIKSTPQPVSYSEDFSLHINSQKYSGPQYSNPTDVPSSVEKPAVSQYKAYSGPISPPAQPSEPVHPRRQPASRPDNQMFRVQNRTEANPVHVLDLHQSQPQSASGACQAVLSTGNLLTPPAFEPKISQQFPRPGYGSDSVAVMSAHTVSLADQSRFARYEFPTGCAASRNQENAVLQQSDPRPPTHHPPPAALSGFTHKESSLAQLPRSTAESGHQRSASRDSQTSTSSHESERLAQEYQAYLPDPRSRFADDEVGFT